MIKGGTQSSIIFLFLWNNLLFPLTEVPSLLNIHDHYLVLDHNEYHHRRKKGRKKNRNQPNPTKWSPNTCDLRASSLIVSNLSGGFSANIVSAASVRSRYTSSIEARSHRPFFERTDTTWKYSLTENMYDFEKGCVTKYLLFRPLNQHFCI